MSDWWYLITMVGVAVGIFALSRRGSSSGNGSDAGVDARRDVARERDDDRLTQMNESDRVRELDNLHRPQGAQALGGVPPEHRP